MKKLSALILLIFPLLTLTSCEQVNNFTIIDYCHAYQKIIDQKTISQDLYIAHCMGGVYIEIPDDYYLSYVRAVKTDKITTYRIYESQFNVSNKGWERVI